MKLHLPIIKCSILETNEDLHYSRDGNEVDFEGRTNKRTQLGDMKTKTLK